MVPQGSAMLMYKSASAGMHSSSKSAGVRSSSKNAGMRSSSKSAGMRSSSKGQPLRLLATAYDGSWSLKSTRKDSHLPKRHVSPGNKVCPQTSPNRRKSTSSTSSAAEQGPQSSSRQAGVESQQQVLSNLRDVAFSSPSSTGGSRRTSVGSLGIQKNSQSVSLPSIQTLAERPDSAGSERHSRREAQTTVSEKEPSEGDGRDEKCLSEHAQEAGVPLDLAKQALSCFIDFVSNRPPPKHAVSYNKVLFGHPFDSEVDLGSMDSEAFGRACLNIAGCKDLSALPDGFLEKAMVSADKDGSGDIDFGEFLYFYYKFSFSEEVMIDTEERMIRSAAREHSIPYDEMSKYKYIFDRTDTNGSGNLDYEEFAMLIARLMKVPKGESLPERRTKEMFREACRDASLRGGTASNNHPHIDFLSFVGWYKKTFNDRCMQEGESPFEAYYHNIRRVTLF